MELQKRMLVVDDNHENIAIVIELFSKNYDLRTVMTGKEAVKIAMVFRPDIILLDIILPDISGYHVCQQLRKCYALADTKIIMVTAKGAMEDRVEGYEVGANDYIVKPFDAEKILESVEFFCKTPG